MAGRTPIQFAQAARAMGDAPSLTDALAFGVESAVDLIDGCRHATVTLLKRRGSVSTAATTNALGTLADELQYEFDEGPCLDAARGQGMVRSDDLLAEPRWNQWSPRAVDDAGMRSVMSVQLHQGERTLGSLNLYSGHTSSFDGDDAESALTLATHLSLAMAAATTREQLEIALTSRVTIGEAKGMLMERYELDEDQSFDVLVRASQHTNRKLIDIATDLVRNGLDPRVLGA